jgi:hypothetical protein
MVTAGGVTGIVALAPLTTIAGTLMRRFRIGLSAERMPISTARVNDFSPPFWTSAPGFIGIAQTESSRSSHDLKIRTVESQL